MLTEKINSFFGKIDEFLHVQFKFAEGVLKYDDVVKSQQELISLLQNLQFENKSFNQAKLKWLELLNGLSVNIGFPHLENVSLDRSDLEKFLEDSRSEIDSKKFINDINKYSHLKFASNGTGLSRKPEEWIKGNDISIPTSIEPEKFKNYIFEITGFESKNIDYQFKQSKSGGFFMMSLFLTPTCFIGHGALNSLFNLSTFAHELGHSTTPREKSLQSYFLSFPDEQNGVSMVSNEDDSYLYEKYFMENVKLIIGGLNIDLEEGGGLLLLKRKAIQNNVHLLKNKMNYLYYSGVPLKEISNVFVDDIRVLHPSYLKGTDYDWLSYSTLDKPLSSVGYIKAYQKNFYT